MIRKTLIAAICVALLGVFAANTAGAAGTPWYCAVPMPGVREACVAKDVAQTAADAVDGTAKTAGNTVNAGRQTGRVVVNGTELGGTILGKIADATKSANNAIAEMPSRTLRPGECIQTASGRWCRPATAPRSAPSATQRVPVGRCVVDSNGTKWCTTR